MKFVRFFLKCCVKHNSFLLICLLILHFSLFFFLDTVTSVRKGCFCLVCQHSTTRSFIAILDVWIAPLERSSQNISSLCFLLVFVTIKRLAIGRLNENEAIGLSSFLSVVLISLSLGEVMQTKKKKLTSLVMLISRRSDIKFSVVFRS